MSTQKREFVSIGQSLLFFFGGGGGESKGGYGWLAMDQPQKLE